MKLEPLLLDRLRERSGFETRRPYVGMSKAGECPLALYREYVDGVTPNDETHAGAWLGYTFERAVLSLLDGVIKPGRELSAFNGLVKGHTDGEFDRDLIEIKSITNEKAQRILQSGRIPRRHYMQCHAYMNYGGYRQTRFIYVPRDFGTPFVWTQPLHQRDASRVHEFFSGVTHAINRSIPPSCECGKCHTSARASA